jgi:hypothetical protein
MFADFLVNSIFSPREIILKFAKGKILSLSCLIMRFFYIVRSSSEDVFIFWQFRREENFRYHTDTGTEVYTSTPQSIPVPVPCTQTNFPLIRIYLPIIEKWINRRWLLEIIVFPFIAFTCGICCSELGPKPMCYGSGFESGWSWFSQKKKN